MKFITILLRHKSVIFSLLGFSFFASCGSYQYVGMSEDGIYGPSESVEYNTPAEDSAAENTDGNSYYKDYFKGKANEYNNDSSVFTDVDEYNGSYDENNQNAEENSYAGWGQNNDSQIVINVQTRPLFLGTWNYPYYNRWGWNNWGWNNWGWNNWGWNVGWNNWGYANFGYWDPFYYNSWHAPYWGGYGANYYYRPYRGRNVAYVNGYRNSRSRNVGYSTSSIANRSALSTVSRTRSNANRSSTSSSRRSYNTTRPTSTTRSRSTTTRTRSVRNSDGTRTTTRSVRTTSQPTRTTTRTRTSNSRNSSYSRPRSSSRSTTTRSSGGSSRSRGGGSTVRRRN